MSNPLFLKLYCQALASGRIPPAESGTIHISALFSHYLDSVNEAVCDRLRLDKGDGIVQACAVDLAGKFAKSGREWILRGKAKDRIARHAPHLQSWPQTLFGQLLSEGLLTSDILNTEKNGDWAPVDVVRFSYQRFADFMIAQQLLANISQSSELQTKLASGHRLHTRVAKSSAGVIEALSVLLPEQFGVELLDASEWDLSPRDLERWQWAFLNSLSARRTDSVTASAVQLFERTRAASPRLFDVATDIMVGLSVRDDHPLGPTYLHRFLDSMSMPQRDASWGIAMYHKMNSGPLGRIIRWAASENHEAYDVGVVQGAAVPLLWMLGTPHRPMRDHITKALTRLLSHRLKVLADLVDRFAGVDDPYIFQRLCLIAHGAVITGGPKDPSGAVLVVRRMASATVARRAAPDLLTRDALRGAIEWCFRSKLLDEGEADQLSTQPRASLCLDSPTEDELFSSYGRRTDPAADAGYGSVLYSVCGMGDFGLKIIDPDIRHFSFYPVDVVYPPAEQPSDTFLTAAEAAAKLQLIADRLTAAYAVEAEDSDGLEAELSTSPAPAPCDDLSRFPDKRARTWIFRRVLELGWTPQLFAEFDSTVPSRGRYCQDLWMRLFQATCAPVDSADSVGVMSMGRSSSLPLWNSAPARTSATRWGAFTARHRACAASISL